MRINQYIVVPALVAKRVVVIAVGVAVVYAAYRWALLNALEQQHVVVGVVALYVLTSYIILPRLHRLLTYIYVPQYFSARTRTADGMLSDPVNIAFIGTRRQLESAMQGCGWVIGDTLSAKVVMKIVTSILFKRSYPHGPASNQYLFGRKQDYSFQKEIDQRASKRHHVRIWKAPTGLRLPGGQQVDWLGAAHKDIKVGLSYFSGQLMHKISPKVNQERDFIVDDISRHGRLGELKTYKFFTPAYHHHTAAGYKFYSDGELKIIRLI